MSHPIQVILIMIRIGIFIIRNHADIIIQIIDKALVNFFDGQLLCGEQLGPHRWLRVSHPIHVILIMIRIYISIV